MSYANLVIKIPEKLLDYLKEVDLESYIIELILKDLNLDNEIELEVRTTLVKQFFEEGLTIIDKNPVQACEKLYKSAEEVIKVLILKHNINDIIKRVKERGRWKVDDFFEAISILRKIYGDEIRRYWSTAWEFHVWGFHEAKATKEYILERIEELVELRKKSAQIFIDVMKKTDFFV